MNLPAPALSAVPTGGWGRNRPDLSRAATFRTECAPQTTSQNALTLVRTLRPDACPDSARGKVAICDTFVLCAVGTTVRDASGHGGVPTSPRSSPGSQGNSQDRSGGATAAGGDHANADRSNRLSELDQRQVGGQVAALAGGVQGAAGQGVLPDESAGGQGQPGGGVGLDDAGRGASPVDGAGDGLGDAEGRDSHLDRAPGRAGGELFEGVAHGGGGHPTSGGPVGGTSGGSATGDSFSAGRSFRGVGRSIAERVLLLGPLAQGLSAGVGVDASSCSHGAKPMPECPGTGRRAHRGQRAPVPAVEMPPGSRAGLSWQSMQAPPPVVEATMRLWRPSLTCPDRSRRRRRTADPAHRGLRSPPRTYFSPNDWGPVVTSGGRTQSPTEKYVLDLGRHSPQGRPTPPEAFDDAGDILRVRAPATPAGDILRERAPATPAGAFDAVGDRIPVSVGAECPPGRGYKSRPGTDVPVRAGCPRPREASPPKDTQPPGLGP